MYLLCAKNFYIFHKYSFNKSSKPPSEKAMEPHSSTLAWKIPWTEEPGRLQSMESLRVGHDWATSLSLFTFMHWRRKWQPTPVFLPGGSQGRGSLIPIELPSLGPHRVEPDWSDVAAAAKPSYEMGIICIPILQVNRLNNRKVKWLAQGHTVCTLWY